MNCPDCKSVVLFGEHYHRPGCDWGIEKTDDAEFDAFDHADQERDEDHGR